MRITRTLFVRKILRKKLKNESYEIYKHLNFCFIWLIVGWN